MKVIKDNEYDRAMLSAFETGRKAERRRMNEEALKEFYEAQQNNNLSVIVKSQLINIIEKEEF